MLLKLFTMEPCSDVQFDNVSHNTTMLMVAVLVCFGVLYFLDFAVAALAVFRISNKKI